MSKYQVLRDGVLRDATFSEWWEEFRTCCIRDGWAESAVDTWDLDALREEWYDKGEDPEFAYQEEMSCL